MTKEKMKDRQGVFIRLRFFGGQENGLPQNDDKKVKVCDGRYSAVGMLPRIIKIVYVSMTIKHNNSKKIFTK